MDTFSDIRPFTDNEVPDAIAAILVDDGFISAIHKLRYPCLPDCINFLLLPLTRFILKRQLNGVTSIDDFQRRMSPYLDHMIASSMKSFSVSGFENLSSANHYLFISNHRDITVDTALISHALFHRFNKTPRIAIGDNLLKNDFASKLLKLNKCFTVNRSASTPRQRLESLKHLSSYIHFCLKEDNHCVWLAQKEGRAKDGLDKTAPAIIKMLAMHKSNDESFAELMKSLNIVPVSISYEYDPCDLIKAKELYLRETTGTYTKGEQEDFQSMGRGILGYKGNVHLSVGKMAIEDLSDIETVTHYLDRQIIENYKLHTSNLLAYQQLSGKQPDLPPNELPPSTHAEKRAFQRRLNDVPKHLRKYWLTAYANPVGSKLALEPDE